MPTEPTTLLRPGFSAAKQMRQSGLVFHVRKWFPGLMVLAELSAYGSDAARQADLDFIANQVPRLHDNFFYQLDPAVFQAATDVLAADLPNLTDAESYDRLAALIAMAGDPHTAI
jgi:hypothetical protein